MYFQIESSVKALKGPIPEIAKLAEKDLQNFFGRDVFLLISLHNPKLEDTVKFTSKQIKEIKKTSMPKTVDESIFFH